MIYAKPKYERNELNKKCWKPYADLYMLYYI